MRRGALWLMVVLCLAVLGCSRVVERIPSDRTLPTPTLTTERPATAADLERGRSAAASAVAEFAKLVRDELPGAYVLTTVTVASVGPTVEVAGPSDAWIDVAFLVTASLRSEPTLAVTGVWDGSVSLGGDGVGSGDAMRNLAVFKGVASLPAAQRGPMVAYLASGSLPGTSARSITLTPLGDWSYPDGSDPPGKRRLVEIARDRGYGPDACVWLWYVDARTGSDRQERGQLLAFSPQARRWTLLATSVGVYPAPVVEVH